MTKFRRVDKYLSRLGSKSDTIFFCFLLNFIICLIMFFRAFHGSALKDWGYSEFLLNYSSGFIRRGFTGTFLDIIYNLFGITPYTFLTFVLSIVIICNLIGFFFLLQTSRVNSITIVLLSSSPLLLNAPFLSVIMYRKDWFIVLGLTLHAIFIRLIMLGIINSKFYVRFFFFFIIYSEILILSHEISFLFISVHLFLIKNAIHCFTGSQRKTIKKLFIYHTLIQLFTLLVISYFHGTPQQVEQIARSIPSIYNLGNVNAILSIGNLPSQQFKLITQPMFSNKFLVFFFLCWFILGPVLIYFLLKSKDVFPSTQFNLAVLPQFSLFALGNDWGRWIILLSFTIFFLSISDWRMCTDVCQENKYLNKIVITKSNTALLFVIFSFFFLFLLIRIPIYIPTTILDVRSGILEILLNIIKL